MNGSTVFAHDGEVGFSGIWTGITAAKSFDDYLINPARLHDAGVTHVFRYSTGATAALTQGETLTGGTSTSSTCVLVYQIVENGTAGSGDSGWLFVNKVSGNFVAEALDGASGTVAIYQNCRRIVPASPAKAALITVETASIRFSLSGHIAGTAAGSNIGHNMDAGQSYVVRGWDNIKKFSAINAVASNGAVIKYSLMF
jgi:hypothetical protein